MSTQIQSTNENAIISVTDSAARQIAQLLSKEKPNTKFRVSVGGGGCSGFRYYFEFVDEQNEDDSVIEKNGAVILVDDMSVEYLKGARIDFVEELGQSGFEITNPNTSSRCGCGNSFNM